MTDRPVPPDEPEDLGALDEDEQRSAAALARALDGGRAEPELPNDLLEAAALLRLSAGSARLGERRRREIRDELLESLPRAAPRTPRARWQSWLLPLLPVAGAAAAYLLFVAGERGDGATGVTSRADREHAVRAEPVAQSQEGASRPPTSAGPALAAAQRSAPLAARESRAAAAPLAGDARRELTQDLARDAQDLRRALLARADDGALARAHAELDAAQSRPALERSRRTLTELSQALGDQVDNADGRLIRQDLYCRLAETALRMGQPQAALEWTGRGLALDGPPTPFLAQLEALEGDAWAALGDDDRAARGYMKALGVHEQLLDEDLDGH